MSNTIGTAYINIAPNMQGIQGKIASGLRGSGSAFGDQFGGEISGKSAVIIGALAGIAQAGVTKAMNLVTSSISNAVARVDTLNAAQKTFQYMGFTANDAATATKAVTASILGLPTPLDGAIRGMTSLAATYGDIKLGQKVFSALNDAILGMGGSTAMVDGAIQQLSQLPLDGPLDAQTWNSLRNNGLTPVMVAMGKDMGKSVSQLKSDFGDGTLKVQDFVNELIKMDTEGGGGLVSLHKIALTATSGISTGFANMQTAISRGLASIIQSIGQKNISNAISSIGAAFETVLKAIAGVVPIIVGDIKGLFDFVKNNSAVFGALAAAVAGAAVAMVALAVAAKVTAAIQAVTKAIEGAQIAMATYTALTESGTGAMAAFDAVTAANPIGIIVVALAAAAAAMAYFFTRTETGKKIFAELSNAVKPVINFVGTQLKNAFNSLASIGGQLATTLKPVIDAFKAIIANKTVQTVLKVIGVALLAIAAGPIVAFFAILIGTITVLSKVLGFLADHFVIVKAILATLFLPLLIPIGLAIGAFKLIQAAISVLPGVFSAVFNAIKSVVTTVFGAIATAWNTVLAPVFSVIATIVVTVLTGFIRVWAAIALVVVGTLSIIAAIIWAAMQGIWNVIMIVWNAIYGVVSSVLGAIWGVITAVFGFISGVIVNAWNFYYGIISSVLGAIWGVITSVWNAVSGFIGGVLGTIGGIVAGAWNAVYNTIAGVVGSIWGAVSGAFNNVITFLGGIGAKIIGVFAGAGKWLVDVGKNIIQGLLDGAGSLLSKIGEFFLDKVPGWIKGPFKKALGISSPSTVFAAYGGNISEGLVNGITGSASGVKKAVSDLANSAIAGMSNANMSANFAANVNAAGGAYTATSGSQQGTAGPAVIQNNTVNNNVDLTKVINDMTWELNRIG